MRTCFWTHYNRDTEAQFSETRDFIITPGQFYVRSRKMVLTFSLPPRVIIFAVWKLVLREPKILYFLSADSPCDACPGEKYLSEVGNCRACSASNQTINTHKVLMLHRDMPPARRVDLPGKFVAPNTEFAPCLSDSWRPRYNSNWARLRAIPDETDFA